MFLVPDLPIRPWQPSAQIKALQERAKMLANIRAFFAKRDVLEVETPQMSLASGTAVHLAPMQVLLKPNQLQGQQGWLQTSPEFAMKRLLVAGSGSIYQICKAYRSEESGRLHNPEFTMLEWYRTDFNLKQMSDEVVDLIKTILPNESVLRITYRDAFIEFAQIDPFKATHAELCEYAQRFCPSLNEKDERDVFLDLILTHVLEPGFQDKGIVVVYDYPASQAELARIRQDNPPVAERFEVFIRGVELANGYHELSDPVEQHQRFMQDLEKRRALNLIDLPVDHALLEALKTGLPACSGVALGIDRLAMFACDATSIAEVMSFVFERC
jgi:lysyl-tRNA synthetase class 2